VLTTVSDNGLALIKHFEGCYLQAYQDSVGVWTIGYGHTGLQHKDGTVHRGRRILRYDMHQFEARVSALIQERTVSQCQFDALVSFDFNTGGLHRSTLLIHLRAGRLWEAANEFPKWDKAGGKTLPGLTRRRAAERDLFCGFGWQRWEV
jgi:lysozyme